MSDEFLSWVSWQHFKEIMEFHVTDFFMSVSGISLPALHGTNLFTSIYPVNQRLVKLEKGGGSIFPTIQENDYFGVLFRYAVYIYI